MITILGFGVLRRENLSKPAITTSVLTVPSSPQD